MRFDLLFSRLVFCFATILGSQMFGATMVRPGGSAVSGADIPHPPGTDPSVLVISRTMGSPDGSAFIGGNVTTSQTYVMNYDIDLVVSGTGQSDGVGQSIADRTVAYGSLPIVNTHRVFPYVSSPAGTSTYNFHYHWTIRDEMSSVFAVNGQTPSYIRSATFKLEQRLVRSYLVFDGTFEGFHRVEEDESTTIDVAGDEALLKIQAWEAPGFNYGLSWIGNAKSLSDLTEAEVNSVYSSTSTYVSPDNSMRQWDGQNPFASAYSEFDDSAVPAAFVASPNLATRVFQKLQYKMVLTPASPTVIMWMEVFVPVGATEPTSRIFRTWTPAAGDAESPVYTIDPLAIDPADLDGAARFPDQEGTWTVEVVSIELAVDANRDGSIKLANEDASDATSTARPFRFWINDDDDSGDTGGSDIPEQAANNFGTGIAGPIGLGSDVGVDGARDLIDWFPVFIDIKQALAVLPPSLLVKYKLKHEGSALNFVYTDISRERPLVYQMERLVAGFGFNFDRAPGEAQATHITAAGVALSNEFLTRIRDQNAGMILIEAGAPTDKPLVLSVEKSDGTVIAEVRLDLKIVPVETMFRHLNLHDRNLPGLVGPMSGGTAQPEAMGDPTGFPDDSNSDSRWLIFVHGFNVSGQASRGWNAEMFKRCYWSGNKSRFVGVSWFGNPEDALGPLPADYHLSMRNAMVTAPVLAQEINALPGAVATKIMFAHSLGCGVVSSAIADHGMNIGRVCFVDAALARECFDGRDPSLFTSENNGMTPTAWKPYDPKLYAANWFNLFDAATDARGRLTWNNRFTRTDNGQKDASPFIYHFYSSTEDVLAEYTGDLPSTLGGVAVLSWDGIPHGSFGWVWQEKGKGNRQNYGIVTDLTHLGSYYGGWGFNLTDPADPTDPIYYFADGSFFGAGQRTPLTTVAGSTAPNWQAQLRRAPLFDPGYGPTSGILRRIDASVLRGPTWIPQLYDTTIDTTGGNGIAAAVTNRSQLLAEAIPSLTWCMGSHESSRLPDERNFNLPSLVNQNNWPRGKPNGITPEWRHSDMREVAYLYQSGVFDKIVELSNP